MSATLFHKITESFAGSLFVGHSEGDLLFLEQVAVKTNTPPALVDAMVQTLFDMKQLASSTVAAPSHIVRFMGQVGIVTPYVEALPLRMLQAAARGKQTKCSSGVALRIILDVVDGLCQYHGLESSLKGGVCPDQVLIGADGETRIGNVPIAAMPAKESPWRGNVHRLAYLAPEQVTAGEAADSRTDVYAVGVLLWELLANQPRFIASAARMIDMLKHANGSARLAPLDTTRLSPRLVETLEKALHPQRTERQPTMGRLARELLEAGEEPAESREVAEYLELVLRRPLQSMRSAIRAQGNLLRTRAPSREPPPPPAIHSDPPSAQKLERVQALPSSMPPESEHTAVYHVTAELLELARRGSSQSDAPPARSDDDETDNAEAAFERTVNLEVTEEMLAQGNRTVTFQVPEDLLEEARRMFENAEAATEPDNASASEPASYDESGQAAAVTSQPLVAAVPKNPIPVLKRPSEETTVPSAKRQRAAAAGLASTASAPRSGNGWLWALIVCLTVALLLSLLRRVRLG
jgi:serine/threonine protein kinase